jgi:hypothetical protein
MFGLRGLIKLILGEDSLAMDESRQMQAQMGMGLGAGGGMGQFNAEAAFKVGRTTNLRVVAFLFIHLTHRLSCSLELLYLGCFSWRWDPMSQCFPHHRASFPPFSSQFPSPSSSLSLWSTERV